MVAAIKFDTSQIDKFERKTLDMISKAAFPLAVKGTLNTLAFETMKESRETIREDFINRNKFTERSVRVEKVKTLKMSDMVAIAGSVAPYMDELEEGATIKSKGKHGLRIPTGAAADQNRFFPRTKVIKKKYRRGQIKLANESGRVKMAAKNRPRFILMSIRVAALRGQSPYVFLPLGGDRAGLYKVIPQGSPPPTKYKRGKKSFSRKFKWGRPKGKPGMEKLVLIHSFARRSITIPETRWLTNNVKKVVGTMGFVFEKEADRVFKRLVK